MNISVYLVCLRDCMVSNGMFVLIHDCIDCWVDVCVYVHFHDCNGMYVLIPCVLYMHKSSLEHIKYMHYHVVPPMTLG